MELIDYFTYAAPVLVLEILATIAGIFYLKKVPAPLFSDKLLVKFLMFVVAIEVLALYAVIGYFSEYEHFSFIKDTLFERNTWVYNIYIPVSAAFFTFYFISQTKEHKHLKTTFIIIGLYLFGALLDNVVNGIFFSKYSLYSQFVGCLMVLLSIILYFMHVLRSDLILNMKKMLSFYIAVGVFFFQLCTTPIFLLSNYFRMSTGNQLFVQLQINVVLFANIFMYSCFILGFIICSRKKKFS